MKRRYAGKVSPNRGAPLGFARLFRFAWPFERSPGDLAWVVHANQPVVLGATSQGRRFATAISARARQHIAGRVKTVPKKGLQRKPACTAKVSPARGPKTAESILRYCLGRLLDLHSASGL